MSRWVLTLFALGFALAPVRAAEPKPLWEIDLGPGPKTKPDLKPDAGWLTFAKDSTLVAVVRRTRDTEEFATSSYQMHVWDAKTRKERFVVELGVSYSVRTTPQVALIGDDAVMTVGSRVVIRHLADGKETASYQIRPSLDQLIRTSADARTCFGLRFDVDREGLETKTTFVRAPVPIPAPPGAPPVVPQFAVAPLPIPRDGLHPGIVALNLECDRLAIGYYDRLGASGTGQHPFVVFKVDEKMKLDAVATVVPPYPGPVTAVVFSPDGRTMATGSADGTTCLWDMAKADDKWKPRATISGPNFTVFALAFRPDGKTLAVGTWDKKKPSLLLIDVPSGKIVREMVVGQLMSVAFSPDGKQLATSGAYEGTIRVWGADELLKAK